MLLLFFKTSFLDKSVDINVFHYDFTDVFALFPLLKGVRHASSSHGCTALSPGGADHS